MYKIGKMVVYGRTGICKVEDITTMKMDGVPKDKLFYILKPVKEAGAKIFTPVDNKNTIMREVITHQEAVDLINEIPEIEELGITNDKLREATYKECMKTCSCRERVKVIKTLYLRKQVRSLQGKKITATDEKYLRMAEEDLYAELSMALGVPENEMGAYITKRVESIPFHSCK